MSRYLVIAALAATGAFQPSGLDDSERAYLGLLLDALDVLLVSYVAGQQPSAGDVERVRRNTRRSGGNNSKSSAHGWRA